MAYATQFNVGGQDYIVKDQNARKNLEFYIEPGNIFDPNSVIMDYFYAGSNQTPTLSANPDFCCYLAEVQGGETYITNYRDYQYDSFDASKQFIRAEYFTANTPRQIADNARYLSISVRKENRNAYMMVKGSTLPSSYVSFGNSLKNDRAGIKAESTKEEISRLIDQRNLFDKNNVIHGYYYRGDQQTPTLAANADFSCYLAEIYDDSAKYRANYRDYQIDAYDKNKQWLGATYVRADAESSVPVGTKYLTVSVRNAHLDDYMLTVGTPPANYVGFGVLLNNSDYLRKGDISPSGETAYHVGEGQTYTELLPLLRTLADDATPKTIYIHEGEYDIFEEYGGQDYMETLTGEESWSEVSVFIPPNTKVIGIGHVVLSFEPTAAEIVSSSIANLFSVINVKHDVYVENLTLKGKNCRYCIHDETSGEANNGVHHTYKNVICKMTHDTYGNYQCYGAGFINASIYDFDECTFESVSVPFSIHNGSISSVAEGSTININNCLFISEGDVVISFRNNTGIQHHDIANINNCYIAGSGKKIELTMSNDSYPNSFDVQLIGCNQITPKVDVVVENLYPVRQYNAVSQ